MSNDLLTRWVKQTPNTGFHSVHPAFAHSRFVRLCVYHATVYTRFLPPGHHL